MAVFYKYITVLFTLTMTQTLFPLNPPTTIYYPQRTEMQNTSSQPHLGPGGEGPPPPLQNTLPLQIKEHLYVKRKVASFGTPCGHRVGIPLPPITALYQEANLPYAASLFPGNPEEIACRNADVRKELTFPLSPSLRPGGGRTPPPPLVHTDF
jgi:hypothetical protein